MIRALLLCLALLPGVARAQTASLVADRVEIAADGRLIAEGNVEVIQDTARLTASRVVYDPKADRMAIEGPLVLTRGTEVAVLASEADLDAGLRTGILTSARLVLDRQLQIAAAEMAQGGDRFTRLSRVTASSCTICDAGETPLWELRASRVIRDAEELQLYFDDAQLRLLGVPIFYLPRLRLPDPALKRSAGFLVPEIRSRSRLGTGLAAPYFVPLGAQADVTLTPYLSPQTTTLETRYRQELSFGSFAVAAAASRDTLSAAGLRGYVFADGTVWLPDDYTLALDLRMASDSAYLLDYGYSEADRLESSATLERVRANRMFRASASSFHTLRADEERRDDEQPGRLGELYWTDRVLRRDGVGEVWLTFSGMTLDRPSDAPGPGRDTSRLSGQVDWRTGRVFGNGLVGEARARLSHDRYFIAQDPAFDPAPSRTTPEVAAALSFPMARAGAGGARHLLVPRVQLAWGANLGDDVPNEDSTNVDLDEGNLFSLNRFPGVDRREEGLRADAGLTWTRYDPEGWTVSATLGRIFRFSETGQFGPETGLSGDASDWLFATHYALRDRLSLRNRTLLADSAEVVRSESRLSYDDDLFSLAGTHLWRSAEPSEGRLADLNEVTLDGFGGSARTGPRRGCGGSTRPPRPRPAPGLACAGRTSAWASTFPSRAATPVRLTSTRRPRSISGSS